MRMKKILTVIWLVLLFVISVPSLTRAEGTVKAWVGDPLCCGYNSQFVSLMAVTSRNSVYLLIFGGAGMKMGLYNLHCTDSLEIHPKESVVVPLWKTEAERMFIKITLVNIFQTGAEVRVEEIK
ncbi:MAG: hypothetical protein H7831_08230 [Magnetococcus sp. WYHC-3]